jgi:hypothetical protein
MASILVSKFQVNRIKRFDIYWKIANEALFTEQRAEINEAIQEQTYTIRKRSR